MSAPRKALVLGGSRYFGRHLIQSLLEQGFKVTVANRGQTPDPFGERVRRRRIDRSDAASLREGLGAVERWDLIYDQICYSPTEARIACELFEGRVGHYVHTSTQSVYLTHGQQAESCFDPRAYPLRMGLREEFDYGEGKRLAEAAYFALARFPVTAVRLPFVLGEDDYTGRLEFHVERVRDGRVIGVPSLAARISMIESREAGAFLGWLAARGSREIEGPINACSLGSPTIADLLATIEGALGRKASVIEDDFARLAPEDRSPYASKQSRSLDPSRSLDLGFEHAHYQDWLPALVRRVASRPSASP